MLESAPARKLPKKHPLLLEMISNKLPCAIFRLMAQEHPTEGAKFAGQEALCCEKRTGFVWLDDRRG
jgi:hypothetical protein